MGGPVNFCFCRLYISTGRSVEPYPASKSYIIVASCAIAGGSEFRSLSHISALWNPRIIPLLRTTTTTARLAPTVIDNSRCRNRGKVKSYVCIARGAATMLHRSVVERAVIRDRSVSGVRVVVHIVARETSSLLRATRALRGFTSSASASRSFASSFTTLLFLNNDWWYDTSLRNHAVHATACVHTEKGRLTIAPQNADPWFCESHLESANVQFCNGSPCNNRCPLIHENN